MAGLLLGRRSVVNADRYMSIIWKIYKTDYIDRVSEQLDPK